MQIVKIELIKMQWFFKMSKQHWEIVLDGSAGCRSQYIKKRYKLSKLAFLWVSFVSVFNRD